jgi:putative transposase
MYLRYRYRLYPSPRQQALLARAFGCARVVFNDALATRESARLGGLAYPKDGELSKALTMSKRASERAWLGEVSSVVLQQALSDLNTAYRNFFNSIAGTRRGSKIGKPRFRSRRDNRQSIRFVGGAFSATDGGTLRLQKIGRIRVAWSRPLPSAPSSVTVIKDAAGRYFASFVVQVDADPLAPIEGEVGIDLGLNTFAVLSNGRVIESPRFLRRAEGRLRRSQKAMSRKQKDSKNRNRARIRVAKAHARVADTRRDWAHKHSTQIIRENQAVYVEDLCIKGLVRTRLGKSVRDAGWGMFIAMLEEKAARRGRNFSKIDRFFPSSQICSECGVRDGKKPLHVRSWTCTCGVTHDRDLNAAKNILAAGLAERLNACGGDVRPALVLADAREAGTRRGDRIAA